MAVEVKRSGAGLRIRPEYSQPYRSRSAYGSQFKCLGLRIRGFRTKTCEAQDENENATRIVIVFGEFFRALRPCLKPFILTDPLPKHCLASGGDVPRALPERSSYFPC